MHPVEGAHIGYADGSHFDPNIVLDPGGELELARAGAPSSVFLPRGGDHATPWLASKASDHGKNLAASMNTPLSEAGFVMDSAEIFR